MSINPKISVITVCYNAESTIADTMLSVLQQTYENMEYVIIDGKSTDKTMEYILQIKKQFPNRMIQIVSEPDKGIYDAMNKGIKMAKGQWVNLMNAGDLFADNQVLEKIFSMNIPTEKTFIYSDIFQKKYNGDYFLQETFVTDDMCNLIHQSVIYRKELHNEFGFYAVTNKIIISDYLFFLRVPLEQMMKADTVIAKYEAYGISDTGTWCAKQIYCADVVFRKKTFWSMIMSYVLMRIKSFVLPRRIKEYLKKSVK